MVLEVDTNQRRLSLGLKASYFTDAGDAVEDDAQVRFDQCLLFPLSVLVISSMDPCCKCLQTIM